MTRLFCAALWAGVMLAGAPATAQDRARTVAVFDFELIDTSLQGEVEGVRADETRRLVLIGDALRAALGASDRYELVDTAPAAQAIAEAGYLRATYTAATAAKPPSPHRWAPIWRSPGRCKRSAT